MRKILVMASVMMLGASGMYANGTDAGTVVDNEALLTYEVGGVNQTPAGSEVHSTVNHFVVDRKIDVTIAVNNSPKDVAPGAQQQQLEYAVENQGNDAETWTLTLAENGGDDFDVDTLADCHLYDAGGADLGVVPAGGIDVAFNKDESKAFKVGCDIPAGEADGHDGEIYLVATIKNRPDNTADVDTEGSVAGDAQNVYAEDPSDNGDAKNNGHFTKGGTYHIKTAVLSATKTSIVTADPTGNAKPHRVPGTTVRYCFDVQNGGSGDAEGVRLHDNFGDANTGANRDDLTYVKSGIVVKAAATACECANNTNTDGTAAAATDIYIPKSANPGVTIHTGEHACAYIEATIN